VTNERRARGVARVATAAIASAMVATLAVPAAEATRTSATAPAIPTLRVVAQNFNVFSSGTLRFAFVVDNARLRRRLLAPRPAQPNDLHIVLGPRIADGAEGVRRALVDPARIEVRDEIVLDTAGLGVRVDGALEAIVDATDGGDDPRRIDFAGPGIYPVVLEVRTAGNPRLRAVTFVHRFGTTTSDRALVVSPLVNLDPGPVLQPDGRGVVTPAMRELARATATLLETAPSAFTVHARPEWLEGIATSDDPRDREAWTRLSAALAATTIATTTYVPVDPGDAARSRRVDALGAMLERGRSALTGLGLEDRTEAALWVATAPLDEDGAGALAALGVRTIVVLPQAGSTLTGEDRSARPSRLRTADGTLGLHVVDGLLANDLSIAAREPFLAGVAVAAQLVAERAEILAGGGDPAGRRFVLASRTGAPAAPEVMREALLVLARLPGVVRLAPLRAVAAPPVEAVQPSLRPGTRTFLAARLDLVDGLRAAVDRLSSTLEPASPTRVVLSRMLDVVPSDDLSETQRTRYADAVRARLKVVRTAVRVAPGSTFTHGARESELRVDLTNDYDEPLTVQVRLASDKLEVRTEAVVVTVPAGGAAQVAIPVVARTNGLFPVDVRIFTADGLRQLGRRVEVSARVNAIAGLGRTVTGIGLLLLGVWWIAHLRRAHRKRVSKNHPVLRSRP
jgi:hypothetical protein